MTNVTISASEPQKPSNPKPATPQQQTQNNQQAGPANPTFDGDRRHYSAAFGVHIGASFRFATS